MGSMSESALKATILTLRVQYEPTWGTLKPARGPNYRFILTFRNGIAGTTVFTLTTSSVLTHDFTPHQADPSRCAFW